MRYLIATLVFSCFQSSGQLNQAWEHYENPETKRRMHNILAVSGLMDSLVLLKPVRIGVDQLAMFHTRDYIQKVQELSSANGGDGGECAPVGVGSFEIACLSAGGVIAAVDAVMSGQVRNAYAMVRPPGHHGTVTDLLCLRLFLSARSVFLCGDSMFAAERDMGRGFCIFNNIALAAMHARSVHGLKKVAIVDWGMKLLNCMLFL
jgi:acetoin utilization deacetylase AcuC-like enzyme